MKWAKWWIVLALIAVPVRADPKSVDCHEIGQDSALNESQVEALCRNAESSAPVECFQKLRSSTDLSEVQATSLCQCATSAAPAECYLRSKQELDISNDEAVRVCQESARKSFSEENCTSQSNIAGPVS